MHAYKVSTESLAVFSEPAVAVSFAACKVHDCEEWVDSNIWVLLKTLEIRGEVTLKGDNGTRTVTRMHIEED